MRGVSQYDGKMNLLEWRDSGRIVNVCDVAVFCRAEPHDGEVILCLHGFPTASFDYRKIWSTLAEHLPAVSYDLVGYGFSAKPTSFGYTTFNQADVVEELLSRLSIKRAHLLTHDYGNTIAQELFARRAERGLRFEIASVCMLNGALFPETHRPIFAQRLLIGPVGAIFGNLVPDAVFKRNLARVFGSQTKPSREELRDFAFLFNYNKGKRIAHRLIRYMKERSVYRERWVEGLRSIDVPFRMINGLADQVSGAHLVNRLREVVPELSDIVELDGIGHFPHLESPAEVCGHYSAFMRDAVLSPNP